MRELVTLITGVVLSYRCAVARVHARDITRLRELLVVRARVPLCGLSWVCHLYPTEEERSLGAGVIGEGTKGH